MSFCCNLSPQIYNGSVATIFVQGSAALGDQEESEGPPFRLGAALDRVDRAMLDRWRRRSGAFNTAPSMAAYAQRPVPAIRSAFAVVSGTDAFGFRLVCNSLGVERISSTARSGSGTCYEYKRDCTAHVRSSWKDRAIFAFASVDGLLDFYVRELGLAAFLVRAVVDGVDGVEVPDAV